MLMSRNGYVGHIALLASIVVAVSALSTTAATTLLPPVMVPSPPPTGNSSSANASMVVQARYNTTGYVAVLHSSPQSHWSVHCPGCGRNSSNASQQPTCTGVRETVSVQAAAHKCLFATNGGPFDMKSPECLGPVVSGGVVTKSQLDAKISICFALLKNSSWWLGSINKDNEKDVLESSEQLLCGFSWLVYENKNVAPTTWAHNKSLIAPRTAIGVSEDGKLISLVTDGSEKAFKGLTQVEEAEWMQSLGAEYAIELDGGGSSTMVDSFNGGVQGCPTCMDIPLCCERKVTTITCIHD